MGEELEQQSTSVCPECGDETTIKRTVPWQPDICTVCGSDIPESNS